MKTVTHPEMDNTVESMYKDVYKTTDILQSTPAYLRLIAV